MSKRNKEKSNVGTRARSGGGGGRNKIPLSRPVVEKQKKEKETNKTRAFIVGRKRTGQGPKLGGDRIKKLRKNKQTLGRQRNNVSIHKGVLGQQKGAVGTRIIQKRGGKVGPILRGNVTSTLRVCTEKEIKKKISFKRQTALFNPKKDAKKPITVAGIGNAGSQAVVALSRLGFEFFKLYDFDTVEAHNLSSQYYNTKDIGKTKTKALTQIMKSINPDILPITYNRKYEPKQTRDGILICAVDSLGARKEFCQSFKEQKEKPELIIDARMGGGQIEIYTCETMEEWEETLNVTAVGDPCAARYISYVSMITGSLIANQIKRYCRKESYKKNILFHIDTLQLITK